MEPLEHPNSIHLRAAQGWLELGNAAEAAVELKQIGAEAYSHPEVLDVRWQIAISNKQWTEALQVAEEICVLAPESASGWIHRSYCLHELKRTQEAWDMLRPIADKFPQEWLVCYNLACYACQLGNIEEARDWFKRATEVGNPLEINRLAADDPDLKLLFPRASEAG